MAESENLESCLEVTPKRRRIQHDYRRLSSSGYADNYEQTRKENCPTKADKEDHMRNSSPDKFKKSPKRQKSPCNARETAIMNKKGKYEPNTKVWTVNGHSGARA